MDPGKLEDGGDTVEEAADDEPVQRGGVLHLQYSTVQYRIEHYSTEHYLGQVGPGVHGDGGQGEHRRHA